MRLVWLLNGVVKDTKAVKLGTGKESLLFGSSVSDFLNLLELHDRSHNLACIGIAWSAPRTVLGLRSMSIQMESAGEIGELLHKGELDPVFTLLCGCPVLSWNDGEAVAAAERMARPEIINRPLLVLKLGTSIATGLANCEGISALPLQLAKCLLSVRPLQQYMHPVTGLKGTARDLIGASSVAHTYKTLAYRLTADYHDFCQATVRFDPLAIQIIRTAATGLAELSTLVGNMWSPVDLVLTGKNIEDRAFREIFTSHVCEQLATDTFLREASCDVDMCAAIGAIILSVGRLQKKGEIQ